MATGLGPSAQQWPLGFATHIEMLTKKKENRNSSMMTEIISRCSSQIPMQFRIKKKKKRTTNQTKNPCHVIYITHFSLVVGKKKKKAKQSRCVTVFRLLPPSRGLLLQGTFSPLELKAVSQSANTASCEKKIRITHSPLQAVPLPPAPSQCPCSRFSSYPRTMRAIACCAANSAAKRNLPFKTAIL